MEKIAHDTILAVDLSASMLMEDFERLGRRMNRLEASRPSVVDYIAHRNGDSIGVVMFAGEAVLVSKPTFKHESVTAEVEQLAIGQLKDGTAIGDTIVLALESLLNTSDGERIKTILLLSDGADNRSTVSPAEAAQRAAAQGVVIHTIGVGTEGIAPMPLFDEEGKKIGYRRAISNFDKTELAKIAGTTSGHFFRAADSKGLDLAFASIRSLQDEHKRRQTDVLVIEHAWKFGVIGVILLIASGALRVLRRAKANLPPP